MLPDWTKSSFPDMTKPKLLNRKLMIAILALTLVVGAAGWYLFDFGRPGPVAITEINATSFAQIKNEFNESSGEVRIIALLSPT
jgi:hypothetical protein